MRTGIKRLFQEKERKEKELRRSVLFLLYFLTPGLKITAARYPNTTAAAMWELLCEDTDYDAVLQGLLDRFDADEATVRADLDRGLALLRQAGVLDE